MLIERDPLTSFWDRSINAIGFGIEYLLDRASFASGFGPNFLQFDPQRPRHPPGIVGESIIHPSGHPLSNGDDGEVHSTNSNRQCAGTYLADVVARLRTARGFA